MSTFVITVDSFLSNMKKMIKTFQTACLISIITIVFIISGCSKAEKGPADVTDFEGNTYKTFRIGEQVWMAENLRSTILNDGKAITLASDSTTWKNLDSPAYCWYDNNVSFKDNYGALYNGYTAVNNNICPAGWHIPSLEEWQTLINFIGDSLNAGGKMKEAGTLNWHNPNTGADNSSGFSAQGAGIRYFQGTFSSLLDYSGLWSSTGSGDSEQWFLGLYYGSSSASLEHRKKNYGFSIRCVKD